MKQFYTSYYAKQGRNAKAVSISAKAPSYFYGEWYPKLAPTWDMINGIKHGGWSERDYCQAFLEKLNLLDPVRVVNDLPDGAFLLCYEANDGSFCHRHIVAEWLQNSTGIIVQEWVKPTPVDDILIY